MKKLLFLIVFSIPFFSFSQTSIELLRSNFPIVDDRVVYQDIVDLKTPIKASEIYIKARLWIIDSFYSSKDVLQFEDKENNILIAKGHLNIGHNSGVIGKDWFTLKIEAKDGKYRCTIYDIRYNWKVVQFEMNDPIESWIPGSGPIKLKEKDFEKARFREMVNSFYKALNSEFMKTLKSLQQAIEKQDTNW